MITKTIMLPQNLPSYDQDEVHISVSIVNKENEDTRIIVNDGNLDIAFIYYGESLEFVWEFGMKGYWWISQLS